MSGSDAEGDAAADLLERRWFASMAAASAKHAECDALFQLVESARTAWRQSRAELIRLEALRDALAERLPGEAAPRRAPGPLCAVA